MKNKMNQETIDIIHVLYELVCLSFLLVALYTMWAVITGKVKIEIKITKEK